jgi:type I restriction enzyme S subunit
VRSIPILGVAPLAADRVKLFEGRRPYLATGGVGDEAELTPTDVTYTERPTRADICVQSGDVSFARMQGTKKILEFDAECSDLILSTGFAVLRPNRTRLYPSYLRHWLSSDAFQFAKDRLCSGATQKAITNEKLELLTIPLPDQLHEQQRIAEILDKADALRATRRAALNQLDDLTQSIFLDMFGDPVSNPRKWPQEKLETFFHFRTGKLDSNAAVASGQYPFFTCSREDFRIDKFAFDCEALLLAGNNASADYSVKHYKGKFNAYQRTYVITLRSERNSYCYSRFVLEQRLAELKRMSKGTGTKYLTLELLNRIQIPVPPPELQDEFARRIGAVERLKLAQSESSAELSALFSSIQNRAFRGEL